MPAIMIITGFSSDSYSEAFQKAVGVTDSDDIGNDLYGIDSDNECAYRAHPEFIRAVREVGFDNVMQAEYDGTTNKVGIVDVPDDVDWILTWDWDCYDDRPGSEYVTEPRRVWR